VRGGAVADYRKIHLYDSFGYRESDVLAAGKLTPVTFELAGFTVGVMTCYDLRFPELGRRLVDAGADVLVVPSAWVAGPRKVEHWTTLLRARAIENTVYVVGVGQPGPRYTGHSMVVDPLGDVVASTGDGPAVVRAELDPAAVLRARETNPSLANRRL
jgi:deaminated glutathione amidase